MCKTRYSITIITIKDIMLRQSSVINLLLIKYLSIIYESEFKAFNPERFREKLLIF